MSNKVKQLLINILVAICTAIATFSSSSCAGGFVFGNSNLNQEVNARFDSVSQRAPIVNIQR